MLFVPRVVGVQAHARQMLDAARRMSAPFLFPSVLCRDLDLNLEPCGIMLSIIQVQRLQAVLCQAVQKPTPMCYLVSCPVGSACIDLTFCDVF